MIFIGGCATTAPLDINDSTKESYEKLREKVYTLAKRYAINDRESAESIGYAIRSQCNKEISEVIDQQGNWLRPQLYGSNKEQLIYDFKQKQEEELRQKIWELAISIVVEARNETIVNQSE